MKRRCVIAMAGGVTLGSALPVMPQSVHRIGVLSLTLPRERLILFAALRELGYEEGRNIVIDYQFADGHEDRLPGLVANLVAKKVDLIVTVQPRELLVAKQATSTIPIVMIFGMVPVETGQVASLARPGANITRHDGSESRIRREGTASAA